MADRKEEDQSIEIQDNPTEVIIGKLKSVKDGIKSSSITKPKNAAIIGGGCGAYIGSSMGIAALGTAVAGTLPVAAVGAVVAYQWAKNKELKKEQESDGKQEDNRM